MDTHDRVQDKLQEHIIEENKQTSKDDKESKISGFHGGDYEEWCLLGCYAVRLL
jgi:hypothetical protein